jgi:hypothetical protein
MGLYLPRVQFIAAAATFWNISSEGIDELKFQKVAAEGMMVGLWGVESNKG